MPARPHPMRPEAMPTKKQRLVSGGLKLSLRSLSLRSLAKLSAKLTATLTASLILVAVFLLYTRSGFLLDMGNQVWGCF